MNNHVIKSLIKKDVKSLLLSKKTWMPMLMVSLLLCIILPVSISFVGTYTDAFSMSGSEDIRQMTENLRKNLPDSELKDELISLDSIGKQFTFYFLNFLLITLFLMVTVINSMVSSTNSFVGEKERGTLETLLFSPITIKELFIAKVLASFLPSILITYTAYAISFVLINVMVYPVYHTLFMFNGTWLILMFWMVPALVSFNILLNVLISAKMKTFQEAQQVGGLLVIPFVGLMVSQFTGLLLISPLLLFIIGVVLFLLDLFLLYIITKTNERNSLFENQIH